MKAWPCPHALSVQMPSYGHYLSVTRTGTGSDVGPVLALMEASLGDIIPDTEESCLVPGSSMVRRAVTQARQLIPGHSGPVGGYT